MDMFRGCINSTVEQLINNYNVMYLLKKNVLIKKNIVPMNSTTIFSTKERQEREEEMGGEQRRTIR